MGSGRDMTGLIKKVLKPQFLSEKKKSKTELFPVGFLKTILLTLIGKQKLS